MSMPGDLARFGLVRRVGLLLSLAVIFVIGPVAQTDAADSDNAIREPVATYRPLLEIFNEALAGEAMWEAKEPEKVVRESRGFAGERWAYMRTRDGKVSIYGDEGAVRFIGFSAHSYFDKALALIESDGFDLCMLSYGYIPRGHNQIWTARMTELRNACIAKAHERDMGIGAGVLGAWSGYIVPGFDKKRLTQLPAAAIRYVLRDERIDMLTIGMRLKKEVDANIKTLSGDAAYTLDDRALLTEFSARAFDSDAIKKMRID